MTESEGSLREPDGERPDDAEEQIVVDARVQFPWRVDEREPMPVEPETMARYHDVLETDVGHRKTLIDLREELASVPIAAAVIHAEYTFGDPVDRLNERVATLCSEPGSRFVGFGSVSLIEGFSIRRMLAQVRQCANDYGLCGINIHPSFADMSPSDRRLYPLYAAATEYGIPVAIHTGINYSSNHSLVNERPILLDVIACDFPDLRLIACHAGWPWGDEMVAVARKHRSVYLDFGGLAPRYVASQGTGWETVFRFANSLLQDQILFASDWPAFPPGRSYEEWEEAPLRDHVKRKLFAHNIMELVPQLSNVVSIVP